MSLLPHSSAEQNPYQAPIIHNTNNSIDRMTAELASPWARIIAVLINGLLNIIAVLPMFYSFTPSNKSYSQEIAKIGFILGLILVLGLTIWQITWVAQYGQTIGKKIMNIKVIKIRGEKAGFNHIIFMREIIFAFIATISINLIIIILTFAISYLMPEHLNALSDSLAWLHFLPYLICLPMLFFPKNSRRTLQDYLAKTLVIKA